jgi:PAS domain S-box-containing protein
LLIKGGIPVSASSKIAFIAPNQKLYDQGVIVCSEYPFNIYLGDLMDGVALAKKAWEDGAEVIISRGGTATLIRQHLHCPLIELRVTLHDIVRTLIQAKKTSTRIGMIGFANIIEQAGELSHLLDMNLTSYVIDDRSMVDHLIHRAQAEGIEVIVGDAITVRRANELGLTGYFIPSGVESVRVAVEEARRFVELNREEREKAALLKTVFSSIHDGIIAIDKDGLINLVNEKAAQLMGISLEDSIGKLATDAIPHYQLHDTLRTGKEELGKVQRIKDKYVVENHIPIKLKGEVIGAVSTIQDVTELQRAERKARNEIFHKGLHAQTKLADIVAVSPGMKSSLLQAEKFGKVESAVFITGESGTGKEMFAQGIHNVSKRSNGPFVAVNCATFTETLLESELFGYVDGAFTGARKGGKPGLFELAHEGTLFLDEIGEMPYNLQAHLLRVLQEGKVRRIGADYLTPIDVRIISATNVNIEEHVAKKLFRSDLYYRLNILPMHLPPLRERIEDLPELVSRFIPASNRQANKSIHGISKQALDALKSYSWPGNIRQLANFIQKVFVLAEGPIIVLEDVLPHLHLSANLNLNAAPSSQDFTPHILPTTAGTSSSVEEVTEELLAGTLEQIERKVITRVFEQLEGNYSLTAKKLGIHRSTLHRKMKDIAKFDNVAK